jgi:hypothetical protein
MHPPVSAAARLMKRNLRRDSGGGLSTGHLYPISIIGMFRARL